MPWNPQRTRKRMIDRHAARRAGEKFYSFMRGQRARKAGQTVNPFPEGTALHRVWLAGWSYAGDDRP